MFFHLFVYVPVQDAEKLKQALFNAGAGKYEHYDQCCWEVRGIGQFRPLTGSNPFIGAQNTLEKVEEVKIEMICEDEQIKGVLKALKENHPYEEPAYGVIGIKTLEDF
ncbi:hypothetical protein Sulku_1883 [Sulfuricurvum kujiense DSM 16994]|uniref:NGG1p interacting factor NIF3 n=1 Tax=Sulfuricurvum kujiense (strain ATCC BAA-921 / DSM 16994 / JCM 11577 / YK-1) TaxID=709032 RepID=E4U1S0_SULKY|nr:NIF3 1 [Sulfuricurvum kujiense]ADR34543.1 hypothetical protein Sulku_1883 [Sulfuricurvum kujiense DSM 16994]